MIPCRVPVCSLYLRENRRSPFDSFECVRGREGVREGGRGREGGREKEGGRVRVRREKEGGREEWRERDRERG